MWCPRGLFQFPRGLTIATEDERTSEEFHGFQFPRGLTRYQFSIVQIIVALFLSIPQRINSEHIEFHGLGYYGLFQFPRGLTVREGSGRGEDRRDFQFPRGLTSTILLNGAGTNTYLSIPQRINQTVQERRDIPEGLSFQFPRGLTLR